MSGEIARLVQTTPFVDTHEHLWDETTRLRLSADGAFPNDFSAFFFGYPASDLGSAGMPLEDFHRLKLAGLDPADKWRSLEPYYLRAWHTAYMQNVRASIWAITGEEELTRDSHPRISEKLVQLLKPGHYRRVLRAIVNVEYCQVASLEAHVFHETESPDLLCQDLHFDPLCLEGSFIAGDVLTDLAQAAQVEPATLANWHEVIDWHFAAYGPRAIALKHASAYARRLDYAPVGFDEAAPLFARYATERASLQPEEKKALSDHLFHYCIRRAVEYGLPVKLHTGYHAGFGGMPLHRTRDNLRDLCPILQRHPDARFVLFHIGYPYQREAIALAKHYPNAYVDLCWAWIINSAATVRFVKEFLVSAPANKLLCFGGDYWNLEGVPGHAIVARKGLTQAIEELMNEGWIESRAAPSLVEDLMRGNARALFDYDRALSNWQATG